MKICIECGADNTITSQDCVECHHPLREPKRAPAAHLPSSNDESSVIPTYALHSRTESADFARNTTSSLAEVVPIHREERKDVAQKSRPNLTLGRTTRPSASTVNTSDVVRPSSQGTVNSSAIAYALEVPSSKPSLHADLDVTAALQEIYRKIDDKSSKESKADILTPSELAAHAKTPKTRWEAADPTRSVIRRTNVGGVSRPESASRPRSVAASSSSQRGPLDRSTASGDYE